ncbi:MBL fold metallo-hydrolase [Aureliella helgolandensis]|uniref:Ribonuclease n=1 Tax=Aureliella helgolandensis TaxID=2527968 RepID=A0A518G339_9BACT|nr:MBL fold metallo-hydrolase [Aureliella helgolandensis]QDV23012.1 Ribonuclease [Aureliella helgolandensis]
MHVIHHGALNGVTGSCHQLVINEKRSLLIDCGLFQGSDAKGRDEEQIDFPLDGIQGLIVTHVHLDHVGRIPYLIAAGFNGPIYCSPPTAKLLPLMMEDAMRVGITRNKRLIERFLHDLRKYIRPLPFARWQKLDGGIEMRLTPAGHVLGSAIVELDYEGERFVFSGDLGSRHQPILKEPVSPERADYLVLESTYGDRNHVGREERVQQLENVLCHTLENKGVTIIPAFSVGRTQELLYEMNLIFERLSDTTGCSMLHAVDVIIDSPLAQRFTEIYDSLRNYWGDEAKQILEYDSQPLVFENLVQIDNHPEHRDTVEYLKNSKLPAIVIAASGMCTGGRVVNYLKAFLGDPTTDVIFAGYQAAGTPGRYIQDSDWVRLDGQRFDIAAKVHQLSGYSAHADQSDLIRFVEGMAEAPKAIRLVHGEDRAKATLKRELEARGYNVV